MDLKSYLRSLPDKSARESFARLCCTTLGHMNNCIYAPADKPKHLAPETCVLVELHSFGAVKREELRPDWRSIWLEIADQGRPLVPAPAVEERAAA